MSKTESSTNEQQSELTLNQVLETLLKENNLIEIVVKNLTDYCNLANSKFSGQPYETRKKLFLVNNKYSHHDEIDERL